MTAARATPPTDQPTTPTATTTSDTTATATSLALAFMNDTACAGQTAKGFANNCVQMGSGYQAKDPMGQTPLYLQAGDGELPATRAAVADEILQFCEAG